MGRGREQPDWFLAEAESLQPLVDKKNDAHRAFLRRGRKAAKKQFRKAQRELRDAVIEAKDNWVRMVANVAEASIKCSGAHWKSLKQLQLTARGRVPRKSHAVLMADGQLASHPNMVLNRWREHFRAVLNQSSQLCLEVLESMKTYPTRLELDTPPTMDELVDAVVKMRSGKAGGQNGILPELLLYGGHTLWGRLLRVMQDMWLEGVVVQEWRDAVVVPIPKKGDLRYCDNWRGISLLDVAGKVFARLIQQRLQTVAEEVVPESQCGFRKERGCVDMIFAARQLIEKCYEHDESLFILFIDLRKAYDSVPRSALWRVLENYGVPPMMLSVIKSFHHDMTAVVRVDKVLTDPFGVNCGLRQGCTLAPTLFSMYFAAVVDSWRQECSKAGIWWGTGPAKPGWNP